MLVLEIPLRLARSEFEETWPRDPSYGLDDFHVVNPIPSFQEYAGEKIYWERSQGHLTPLGCDLVGRDLAEHILEHDLLQ